MVERAKADLVERYQKLDRSNEYAAEQVKLWRAKHPVRAAAHDRGVVKDEFLEETTKARQLRELDQRQLSEQFEDAKRDAKKVRQEVEARVARENAQTQGRVDVLESIARKTEAREQHEQLKKDNQYLALQAFEDLAAKRKQDAPGYGDAGAAWQTLSAPTREGIDVYNRLSKADKDAYLQRVQQNLERDPQLARGFIQMAHNAAQYEPNIAPDRDVDRGMSR